MHNHWHGSERFAGRIRISNVIFYSPSLKSYDKIIFFEKNVTPLASLATPPLIFNHVYKIKDLRAVYIYRLKYFIYVEKETLMYINFLNNVHNVDSIKQRDKKKFE